MPSRFRSFGNLDDPLMEDGDLGFVGIDQFSDPTTMKDGYLQLAENVRIDSGVVTTRGGMSRLSQLSDSALTGGRFSDPDGADYMVAVGPDYSHFAREDAAGNWAIHLVSHPETILAEDEPYFLQTFGKVIIFRKDKRPLEFDGDITVLNASFVEKPETTVTDPDLGEIISCPGASFGNYFRNRLVVPNRSDSPTTIIFSDLFETDRFLRTNEFYLNKGTSDETRAIAPYLEDQILVLNKRSVHLVNNVTNLGTNSSTYEITRQFGVIGPRAWAQSGPYTYFVSSEGDIQVLVPSTDPAKGLGIAVSKVTAETIPLSRPIDKVIRRLNLSAARNAKAVSHKNKIYFALPLDGSSVNNYIAVYDALYSNWVSIDKMPSSFGVKEFFVVTHTGAERLVLTGTDGSSYLYEEGDIDGLHTGGFPISSRIKTRAFLAGSRGLKRFVRGQIGVDGGTSVSVSAEMVTPDLSTAVNQSLSAKSRLTRFSIRRRGYACCLDVVGYGSPSYKNVMVEASVSGRQTMEVQ